MILNDYVPKLLLEHNYKFLEHIVEGITNQSVVSRVKLDSTKMEQLLGRQPKLSNVSFSHFLVFFFVSFKFVFE